MRICLLVLLGCTSQSSLPTQINQPQERTVPPATASFHHATLRWQVGDAPAIPVHTPTALQRVAEGQSARAIVVDIRNLCRVAKGKRPRSGLSLNLVNPHKKMHRWRTEDSRCLTSLAPDYLSVELVRIDDASFRWPSLRGLALISSEGPLPHSRLERLEALHLYNYRVPDKSLPALQSPSLRELTLASVSTNAPRQLLSPKLESLRLIRPLDGELNDLLDQNLPRMRVLGIIDTTLQPNHLSRLGEKRGLQSLDLSGSKPVNGDFSFLSRLTRLKKLHLRDQPILDASAFRNLRTLELLDVTNSTVPTTIIGSLPPSIQRLVLTRTNITTTQGLENLAALTHLDLSGTVQLRKLVELDSLVRLRRLDLSGTVVTRKQIEQISRLPQLTHLSLDTTSLLAIDVEQLRRLNALTHLSLAETSIDNTSTQMLATMTSLSHLNLRDTAIDSEGVDNLTKLRGLRFLDISNTGVDRSVVDALALLPRLRILIIENPGIETTDVRTLPQVDLVRLAKCTPQQAAAVTGFAIDCVWSE